MRPGQKDVMSGQGHLIVDLQTMIHVNEIDMMHLLAMCLAFSNLIEPIVLATTSLATSDNNLRSHTRKLTLTTEDLVRMIMPLPVSMTSLWIALSLPTTYPQGRAVAILRNPPADAMRFPRSPN